MAATSSRSQFDLSKIVIRIILIVKCYSRTYSPNLRNCRIKMEISNYVPTGNSGKAAFLHNVRRPFLGLGLPPFAIIAHLIGRWQLVE
ncbi:hypothetical protein TNCV_1961031 [Trichonephila clavipes]|nr:hypothetical protein TNCV_1961031 [Trichonephila clavipes]